MAGLSPNQPKRALRADINVTPLVDVVLVLLIIFMVITPLLHANRALQLPTARSAVAGSALGEPLVLSVGADRQLRLANEPLPDQQLTAALSARAPAQLLIRADSALSMRELRPLLRQIKAAGLHQIAFALTPWHGSP